jgi:hypothetical protein
MAVSAQVGKYLVLLSAQVGKYFVLLSAQYQNGNMLSMAVLVLLARKAMFGSARQGM